MQRIVRIRLVLACLVSLALASAASAADVSGTWEMTVHASDPLTWTLTVEQKGDSLSGKIKVGSSPSDVLDVTGKVSGDHIEFTFTLPDSDGDRPFNLSGEVAGDTIQGTKTNLWMFGEGDWTAKHIS